MADGLTRKRCSCFGNIRYHCYLDSHGGNPAYFDMRPDGSGRSGIGSSCKMKSFLVSYFERIRRPDYCNLLCMRLRQRLKQKIPTVGIFAFENLRRSFRNGHFGCRHDIGRLIMHLSVSFYSGPFQDSMVTLQAQAAYTQHVQMQPWLPVALLCRSREGPCRARGSSFFTHNEPGRMLLPG